MHFLFVSRNMKVPHIFINIITINVVEGYSFKQEFQRRW